MKTDTENWSERPWILAVFLAFAGLAYQLVIDDLSFKPDEFSRARLAAAVFILITALSFAFALERMRWTWAIAFSLAWGLILAGVSHWAITATGADVKLEFPFWSGLLAAAIALPLFQTVRDAGRFALPYQDLHCYAWSDVVCWCSSFLFVGISFALAHLLAALFNLIGLDFLKELLKEEWFIWMFVGISFGGALGVLKENHRIVANLQNLVMTIMSILSPVLCVALVLFLVSLPFTGLEPLWNATEGTTPILLSCALGSIVLANAIIRNSPAEESNNSILRYSALGLSLCILPLAAIAWISMQQRVAQYGFTPDRIWGLIAVGLAIAYGVAYLISFIRFRAGWMHSARDSNTKLAVMVCALTVFLALPIMDFGSVSAKNQLARLQDGRTTPGEFDFVAFAYDFGNDGREALKTLMQSDDQTLANGAKLALETENRWSAQSNITLAKSASMAISRLKVFPEAVPVPTSLMKAINEQGGCIGDYCLLIWEQRANSAKLLTSRCAGLPGSTVDDGYSKCPPTIIDLIKSGSSWQYGGIDFPFYAAGRLGNETTKAERDAEKSIISNAISQGDIEIRTVERRQLFIGGRPVGKAFE